MSIRASLGRDARARRLAVACGGRTVVVSPRVPLDASADWRNCASIRARRRATCSGASAAAATRRRRTPPTSWSRKTRPGSASATTSRAPTASSGARRSDPRRRPRWSSRASCGDSATTSRRSTTCPSWTLDAEGETEGKRSALPPEARRSWNGCRTYWSWADNPFSGTRELKGLLVVLLMLNSTDLKDDNNSIYEVDRAAGTARHRRAMVRRARSRRRARRNRQALSAPQLARGVRGAGLHHRASTASRVEFDYDGRHQELLAMIGPADVQWAARQMSRLTDAQWRDAFRAGNYADPERQPLHLADSKRRLPTASHFASTAVQSQTTSDADAAGQPLPPEFTAYIPGHSRNARDDGGQRAAGAAVGDGARRGARVPPAAPRHAAALRAGHPDADHPRRSSARSSC